jgi:hypothetical protein
MNIGTRGSLATLEKFKEKMEEFKSNAAGLAENPRKSLIWNCKS